MKNLYFLRIFFSCVNTQEASTAATSAAESVLEISVSDPVKQGDGVQAFVTYRVSLKVS